MTNVAAPYTLGRTLQEQVRQDVRYAVRGLRKAPAFTGVAVLSLGLGIGAGTALFSVVDAVALRTLPARAPGRLVLFREHLPPDRIVDVFPYEALERFRRLSGVFSNVAGVAVVDRSNVATDGPGGEVDPSPVRVALASGEYFATLGVSALRGRALTPEDDRVPDGEPVAVISHGYWQRRFASDPGVLGHTLRLHATTYTIVGVMPVGFTGDWIERPVDIWMPMMMESEVLVDRPKLVTDPSLQGYFTRIVARLQPGIARLQAQAAASVEQQKLLHDMYPTSDPRSLRDLADRHLVLESAVHGYSPARDAMSQALVVLGLIVAVVLLIACANVAGLVAARTGARAREMALRRAIGAGRARLLRQLFAESVVMVGFGAVVGVGFAGWAAQHLVSGVTTGQMRATVEGSPWMSFEPRIDARALAVAAALSLLAVVMVGLWPALRGSGASLTTMLTPRGPSSASRRDRWRFGRALVVAQVALSLLALVDTGLLVQSLNELRARDVGYDRRHTLLVWAQPGLTGRQGTALADYWRSIAQRAARIPGVVSAGAANGGVLDGYEWTGRPVAPMRVAGKPVMPSGIPGYRNFVTPGFFAASGLPIVRGRDFTDRDTSTALPSVIINERMATYYFGADDPVGRIVGFPGDGYAPTQVIGVVRDATSGTPRERELLGLTYFFYRHPEATPVRIGAMVLALRTSGNAASLSPVVSRWLRDVAPDLPVLRIDTVEQQLDDVLSRDRLLATLGTFLATVSLLLACCGLYGLIAYTTSRRTMEIGVRMALGATVRGVLVMVIGEGALLVVAGLALGIPLVFAARRLIAARLVHVGATDPLTIALSTALLAAVATGAAFVPAQRAASVDPSVALRHD